MKILQISLLSLCISTGAYAKTSHTTLQIIMDDSGVLIHSKEADKYKLGLLSHIKDLVRKREYANAHIDVISTSIGRTIWSGLPSDLKRKPERALALVESIKTQQKTAITCLVHSWSLQVI